MKKNILANSIKLAGLMMATAVSCQAFADPVITLVKAVVTPTNVSTPTYNFSSDTAGTIIYGGSCTAAKKSAVVGNNFIKFNALAEGTYSNCTIQVKDAGNVLSNVLNVNTFTIDKTKPVISMITPMAAGTYQDTTPGMTVNVSEKGTILAGLNSPCVSATSVTAAGSKVHNLQPLLNGTYYNCSIRMRDLAGNYSNTLYLPIFTIQANNTSANPAFVFTQTSYVGAVQNASTVTPWWSGWTLPGTIPSSTVAMNGGGTDGYTAPTITLDDITLDNSAIIPLDDCPDSNDPANMTIDNVGEYTIKGKTYQVCQISGDIMASFVFNNRVVWSLSGKVNVGDGNQFIDGTFPITRVSAVIQAGTVFRNNLASALVVTRGSKITAVGTPTQPIIMTSNNDDDFSDQLKWGSLILQGFAYDNLCGDPATTVNCNIAGEGAAGYFGGVDNADSSGILKYVVIAESGSVVSLNNELNGLGLMGVGYGTIIDHIQIHNSGDDGIEFWGGAADVKYSVLTSNADDNYDWDEGYVGNIQFGLVVQTGADGTATHGFECDTKGDAKQSAYQESNPTVANVTAVSVLPTAQENRPTANANFGMQLKEGTEGHIINTMFLGDWKAPLRFEDNFVMTAPHYATPNDAFLNVYGNSVISNVNDYNTSGYNVTTAKFGSVYGTIFANYGENSTSIPTAVTTITSMEVDGTAD